MRDFINKIRLDHLRMANRYDDNFKNYRFFQEVFDLLQDALPPNWTKVVFFAEYKNGSYSMKYYCKIGDGAFIDCFDLDNVSRLDLVKLFARIDKVLSKARAPLDNRNRWSFFSMIVDSNGGMKANFGYDDQSEEILDREDDGNS